jgi:hypothetical protein
VFFWDRKEILKLNNKKRRDSMGIEFLDRTLVSMFRRPVQAWCAWTGTSNFTLARGVIVFAGCLLAVSTFLELVFFKTYVLLFLHTLGVVISIRVLWVSQRRAARLEEALREMENKEAYSPIVYVIVEHGRVFRVFFLGFGVYIALSFVVLVMEGNWSFGYIFAVLPLLLSVHDYISICFEKGGGGKARQIIRNLAGMRWHRSPATHPNPA